MPVFVLSLRSIAAQPRTAPLAWSLHDYAPEMLQRSSPSPLALDVNL